MKMSKIIAAKVSSINKETNMIQVTYDGIVSDFLYLLTNENNFFNIGDDVACAFFENQKGGVCLGKFNRGDK